MPITSDMPAPHRVPSRYLWLTRGLCWFCGILKAGMGQTVSREIIPICPHCKHQSRKLTLDQFRAYLEIEQFWGEEVGLKLPLSQHYYYQDWI